MRRLTSVCSFFLLAALICESAHTDEPNGEYVSFQILLVVVEDARNYEYSIRLDLVDPDGAALDSTVVLARADQLTHFEMTADELRSEGTIRIAREASDE